MLTPTPNKKLSAIQYDAHQAAIILNTKQKMHATMPLKQRGDNQRSVIQTAVFYGAET